MTKLNELKNKYGSVRFNCREYVLIQDTYVTGALANPYYTASAIDENGNEYMVVWEIKDLENFAELEDESNACDWDNPSEICLLN